MSLIRPLTPEERKDYIPKLVQNIRNAKDVSCSEKELRKLLSIEGKTLTDVDITEEEIIQAKKEYCLSNIDSLKNGVDYSKVEGLKEDINRAILELEPLGFSLEDLGLKSGEVEQLAKFYHADYVKMEGTPKLRHLF